MQLLLALTLGLALPRCGGRLLGWWWVECVDVRVRRWFGKLFVELDHCKVGLIELEGVDIRVYGCMGVQCRRVDSSWDGGFWRLVADGVKERILRADCAPVAVDLCSRSWRERAVRCTCKTKIVRHCIYDCRLCLPAVHLEAN